ncbi:Prenylated rab acceptor [Parasponia andersonii]|uniref:PRA1 family protein n=1 Tax=Parasponia andersonii TaxID=3476 RepID=A0A2P5CCQ5_PARAD|nr:Prenylated rab acceptor [Parasponia andersonii]
MANYGTVQRPSTTSPSPSTDHPYDPKDSTKKSQPEFNIICPFSIPTTPEAAAARITRNLGDFGLYYALFIWLGLFIALIPQRKVSLIYLVAMTYVTSVYLLVLRALPNSVVLNTVIDKRLVLALLAIATMVELILTRAAIHLFASLGIGVPLILVHAVLTIRDDLFVGEEATSADQLVPLRNSNETQSVDIV